MSLRGRHMRKGENCADICNLQQKFLIHMTQSLFFPGTFADHKTYSWAHTNRETWVICCRRKKLDRILF